MAKTRYNAVVARPGSNGSTFWHRIGTAFENAKGFTVYFDSLPLPDEDGKVKVMLFEAEDEQRQERGSGERQSKPSPRGLDDEVPF